MKIFMLILLGSTGLHHFYLHKWLRGFVNSAVMLLGISLFYIGTTPLLGGAFIIIVFIIETPQACRQIS